jgi:hypothetical protein
MFSMLKLAFWTFVLLLALSFFGISIEKIIMSPAGQANFGFALYWILYAWQWLVALVHSSLSLLGL